jgi:hypothetical protein
MIIQQDLHRAGSTIFSHLETIEVYTVSDNVNLAEVFQAMEKSSDSLPDIKDNNAIRKYFEQVYGDIDFERVYNSDLKKMIKWFEVLKKNNVEIKLAEPEPEEEAEEKPEPVTAEDKKKSPAASEKKAAKKTPKASSEKKDDAAEKKSTSPKTAKPAKKAVKKKGK